MKAIQGFVSIGLCLVTVALAGAQGGSCDATFTKKSMKASTRFERGHDIQFEATTSCAAEGTLEYTVDLSENGKVESQSVTANFRTQSAGTSTITVTFPGVAFKELKAVRDAKRKTCTCGS
ncbi:MAG: hypothetical protein ABI565_12580 [Vicinamibacteria bacterium]